MDYPRVMLTSCFVEAGFSRDKVVKFDIAEYLNENYLDKFSISSIYKKIKMELYLSDQALRRIYEVIMKIYTKGEMDPEDEKCMNEVVKFLNEVNTFPFMVPLSSCPDGFLPVKGHEKIKMEKPATLIPEFLITVNVLCRSSKFAFLPHREPQLSRFNLRRILYTRDEKFISWVKVWKRS